MRVLVTGISGFVGPHLKHELQKAGHNVFGVDRESKSPETFTCDLTDKGAVTSFFEKNTFDWVIHLAALTSVNDSWKNPKIFFDVNVGMAENVYRALEETNPNSSVLLVSSSDVYGSQNVLPISETAVPRPKNPYGESKLAQEQAALKHTTIKTVISRAFNHSGPGSSPALAIPNFARQIALVEKGMLAEIKIGNLESFRDYSDVRDIVRGYRLLIEKGKNGQIYNICSGTKRKMKDILNALCEMAHVAVPIVQDPDLMRPSDVPEFFGSYEKIQNETGWKPEIPFAQTLQDTLDYWREKA